MGLGRRRNETSNFCRGGCPLGTYPFRQYWVTTDSLNDPSYGGSSYLYLFTSETVDGCIWDSVTTHFAGSIVERLIFRPVNVGPGFAAYEVTVEHLTLLGFNGWRQIFVTPLPEQEGLVNPNSPTSCSRMVIELPNVNPSLDDVAIISPAYPDACTDDDFPEKLQVKPLARF